MRLTREQRAAVELMEETEVSERRGWEACREAAAQLVLDRSVASVRAVETAAAIRKLEPPATGAAPAKEEP